MSDRTLLLLTVFAFTLALVFACTDGQDGKDGEDGHVIYGDDDNGSVDDDEFTDDDADHPDDDSPDDDADDDDADDDDSGDNELTSDELFYAEECPALAECVVANCQEFPDPDSFALLDCTFKFCADPYDACFGPYGAGECVQILKCLEACLPADCLWECLESSSYEELLEFSAVGICVEDNCPEALADPLNNIGCFLGACLDPVATCCGGTIFGCM